MTLVRRLSHLACALLLSLVSVTAAQAQATPRKPDFAAARPGDLRVYMSGALRPAVDKMARQLEAAVGRPLVFEVRQARLLQQSIEGGAAFDAALLTQPVMQALARDGRIDAASLLDLGDNPLGVTARGDLSRVDMSTPEALRKTLLGARSVGRSYGVGATAPLIDHLFRELGVAEAVKDKVNPRREGAPTLPEAALGPGEYELDLILMSEIRPRAGWSYVGVLPRSLRLPNVMTAGVSPAGNTEPAARLIAFLRTPAFKEALAATGMEPL